MLSSSNASDFIHVLFALWGLFLCLAGVAFLVVVMRVVSCLCVRISTRIVTMGWMALCMVFQFAWWWFCWTLFLLWNLVLFCALIVCAFVLLVCTEIEVVKASIRMTAS